MVSTDKFNLLHSYIFRKNNVIMDNTFSYKDKSILYICQNGTSGYANAAKGYIYDYIGKKIPVKTQYFNCSDEVNENDRFHQYLNSNTLIDIEYNTIIVHSTPDIWTVVIKNTPNINLEGKRIIGRTVWEFEKLLPAWVDAINTSIVDIVSVPTEWNKQCFIKNGVIKPIIVEPHIYVDYPHKKTGLKHLLTKSILVCKNENTIDLENSYKFYCIGQMIKRKGIIATIDAFCNAFTSNDKVVLFVKTFELNYNKEEQQKCLLEITKITDKYDHAPIIYIKDNLNYDEIKSLHDIGDCYFHLTKTEGFCLGAFDAFNNDKKVIITGYGGHTEYLGKDYDGLVDYKLNSLAINESVFFQFKLDDTYKWAIADKEHAVKLLRSKLDVKNKIEFINLGKGFYSLEKSNEQSLQILNDKITFVFVDDLYPDRCLEIIKTYEKNGITNIKLLTSKDIDSPYRVKIDSIISTSQYSEFILKNLKKYIDTDYVLISQWDGYIINFNKWTDKFFEYDYLGAPWWWKDNNLYGGNGGFSLRSKKLLEATSMLNYDGVMPEDEFICVSNLNELINQGFKFATKEFSKTFSVENQIYDNSFGFHNYATPNIASAKSFYRKKFYHSGDLGDIIYSLPFIKAMGGGMLVLSADYRDMKIRSPMTSEKANDINKLLIGQDYIFDIQSTINKPSDIDIDLNNFRKSFIDWGNGKFSSAEVNKLRCTKLTHLYRDALCKDLSDSFDESQWLSFNEKIEIKGKPIIINKTERYPRVGFPWKEIVNVFGNKILFVGIQHEYNDFIKKYGYVDYYYNSSLIKLAHIINGAKLFIGNQSFPYSIAEGLKKNTIQETNNVDVPNCMFVRDNSYLTYTDESLEFNKMKLFIKKHI